MVLARLLVLLGLYQSKGNQSFTVLSSAAVISVNISDQVRDFWAAQFNLNTYADSTLDLYTWNDMNEPSVFNGPEVCPCCTVQLCLCLWQFFMYRFQ